MFVTISRRSGKSLQAQIVEQFQDAIRRGRLAPGTKLPSSRHLAQILNVSRNTTTCAYDRLAGEGFVEIMPASHVRVSDLPLEYFTRASLGSPKARETHVKRKLAFSGRQHVVQPPKRRLVADFWMQRADARSFPLRLWRRLLIECLTHCGENLIEYGEPAGLASLRELIANRVLPDRGIITRPDNVFIFAGAQLALNLVARLLVRSEGRVIIENPANQGAAYLFESYQARLVPISVDENGLITSELKNRKANFAYVTPSHQFPLGATLSLERRHELLNWADRQNAIIVEDDYDSQFSYDVPPLPAIKSLNSDRVIYIGTFSKLLGAGLRIGYAVFPDGMIEATRIAKALLDNGPPWLEQAAMQRFIAAGSYARHLRRVRLQYLRKRDCLVASLRENFGDVSLMGTASGTHICWHLPPSFPSARKVQQLALAKHVGVYTLNDGGGEEYTPKRYTERTLMLGYSTLSETEIRRGIVLLADVL